MGSSIAYLLAFTVGRPLFDRYGKFFRLDQVKLQKAELWFERWGIYGIFIGHSLPGIRSVISFPAGLAKMDQTRFVIFTFLGALVWNTVLVTAGYTLGENWIQFWERTDGLEYVMLGALGMVLVAYYLYVRRKRDRITRASDTE